MLTTLALGFVMIFIWRTQKVYAGFGFWVLSNFTIAVGFFLLGLRDYAPDLLSIVAGNSLAAASMILAFEGNRRFLGLGSAAFFSGGLLVFHALGLAYFTFAENRMIDRIAVSSLCLALISGRSAYSFLTRKNPTPTYKFAAVTYLAFTVMMFLRLFFTYEFTRTSDLFAPDWVQSLIFLTFLLFAIVWMFSYLILNTERLQIELNQAQIELEKIAATDFLTGVNNSRRFYEIGEAEIRRARRFGNSLTLVMFDLDFFKRINDAHGHSAGDKVLIETVEICRRTLRTVDVLGRLGGEEFAVLLPHTDLEGGAIIAELLRQAIETAEIEVAAETAIKFTASFGIAELKNSDLQIQLLLDRADAVLYQAKRFGRNCVIADAPKPARKAAAIG